MSLVQRLRAAGVQRRRLAQRLAQPAVVLGRAAQPHHFRGQRIELTQSGHRRQKGVEHEVGRVGGVIPRNRPGNPAEVLVTDAERFQPGAHPRHEIGDIHLHDDAERAVAQRFPQLRALLAADRRDVDAELLGELGNDIVGSRVRRRREAPAGRGSARTPAESARSTDRRRAIRLPVGSDRRATPHADYVAWLTDDVKVECTNQGTAMPKLPSVVSHSASRRLAGSASEK